MFRIVLAAPLGILPDFCFVFSFFYVVVGFLVFRFYWLVSSIVSPVNLIGCDESLSACLSD